MTAMPLLITRRAAALLALAVIAATFLLAGVANAKTTYPSAVRNAFNKTCIKAATAGGNVTKTQAAKYCNAALVCIEGKLSLKEFSQIKTTDRAIKSCEKSAAKKVFS
jgi:hypothetical protein